MSKPIIGISASVGFKVEAVPGTPISLTGGQWLDIVSESLDYKPVLHSIDPAVGNRQKNADFEFISHHDGGGTVATRVYNAYADELMYLIFGELSGGYYQPILNNTELPTSTWEVDKAGANNLRLAGVKINTASFKSETNNPLELTLELLSMSGARDPGDLQAMDISGWRSTIPFIHNLMSFDATGHAFLGGADGPECRAIEFTINNNLDPEGWTNSQTRKIIPEGLFGVEGNMEIPYNSTTKGFWAEMVAASKVKFSIEYSNGANSLVFDFVVKLDGDLPGISGTEAMWLTLNFHGVADAVDAYCLRASLT